MIKLILAALTVVALGGACSSDDSPSEGQSQESTPAVASADPATAQHFGENNDGEDIYGFGTFTATAEDCEDPFNGGEAESIFDYWDAVSPTSCYQQGAIVMSPPPFDCDDGVAPESPDSRGAVAGDRIVFDIRSLDVKVTSHVIDVCIPVA